MEKVGKIFLSRSKLPDVGKREFGLDMLDNYFLKNGYTILHPESMSLSEMLFMLDNVHEVAAVSGSLPHNLLFAEDGKKLLILERNVLNNEIQVDINRTKNLEVVYIDANIPIYSVNLGWGPFIMAYDGLLADYTVASKNLPPDDQYTSKRYMKKCLAGYMKEYKKSYHYQWFMMDWSNQYIDYLREGYYAGYQYYEEYINGQRPFLPSHYLDIHYWKQFLKRTLLAVLRQR